EDQSTVVPAERRPEAGGGPGRRTARVGRSGAVRCGGTRTAGPSPTGHGLVRVAAQEDACRLRRRSLELAGDAGDGRRGVHDLVGKSPEEMTPGNVRAATGRSVLGR